MLIVYGSILQHISIDFDQGSDSKEAVSFAPHYHNSVGGKGALQAVAAAKMAVKTALVGKTGDDELAKHILIRLRTHGVVTSGVAKSEKVQTGTVVRIKSENRNIIALGASARATADQVPDSILDEQSVLLLQTELNMENNSRLLEQTKEAGGRTILNLSPRATFTEANLEHIDYLILPEALASTLPDLSEHKITVVFLKKDGSCALQPAGGQKADIPKLAIEGLEWTSPAGAEDVFCGTFAAGIHERLPLAKALLRAQIAAALSASKPGAYESIPFSADIEKILEELSG